jgi:uncharacterized protein (TIGR02246 family)
MSHAAIAAVNRQFEEAVASRDFERLGSLYTADAIVLPPGGPVVKGRDNVSQF